MYGFEDYDDDDGSGGRGRTRAALVAVLLAAVGWFVVRPALSDDGGNSAGAPGNGGFVFDPIPETTTPTTDSTTAIVTDPSTTVRITTVPMTTVPATSTTSRAPTTTTTTTTTLEQPAATDTSGTTRQTKAMAAPTTEAADPTRDSLPDGSPAVEMTLSAERITLVGAVPSAEAADQLIAFAESIRLTPATIDNELTINPAVPDTVGVRVVERNAVVFNEGSSTVHPDHARQLDRFVEALNSSPGSTLLVVAHSDQRNGADRNLAISEERAQSVLEYLAAHGIDRSRLSAVGVGESEPLVREESEEAYRVNRRVDFVFTGLFTG